MHRGEQLIALFRGAGIGLRWQLDENYYVIRSEENQQTFPNPNLWTNNIFTPLAINSPERDEYTCKFLHFRGIRSDRQGLTIRKLLLGIISKLITQVD